MAGEVLPGYVRKPLSREAYDRLSPLDQGYASYMQAMTNSVVPEESPYAEGTTENMEWQNGQRKAYIDVIFLED